MARASTPTWRRGQWRKRADPSLAQDYARRQQQMQGIAEGGLQRAGQWAQLMPTLDEAQYAPAERMASVGQF